MSRKKHRKQPENIPEIHDDSQSGALSEAEEAAAEHKLRAEKKRQIIDRNSRKYIITSTVVGSVLLYCGYYVFPNLFYLVFSNDALQNNGTIKLLASTLGFFVYFFYLTRHYMRKRKKHPEAEEVNDILEIHPKLLEPKKALQCAAAGFCLNLSLAALMALLPFPDSLVHGYSSGSESLLYTDNLAFSIIYIWLFAPLCEELMFRGFLLHKLKKAFPAKVVIWVVSAAFALPHVNIMWIIVAFGCSLIFTAIREKHGNLLYSMILHSCYNLASVPMLLLLNTEAYTVLFDNIAAELIYLVLGGITVYLCVNDLLFDGRNPFAKKN